MWERESVVGRRIMYIYYMTYARRCFVADGSRRTHTVSDVLANALWGFPRFPFCHHHRRRFSSPLPSPSPPTTPPPFYLLFMRMWRCVCVSVCVCMLVGFAVTSTTCVGSWRGALNGCVTRLSFGVLLRLLMLLLLFWYRNCLHYAVCKCLAVCLSVCVCVYTHIAWHMRTVCSYVLQIYIHALDVRPWCHNHLNFIRRSVYDLRRSRSPRVVCVGFALRRAVTCIYCFRVSRRGFGKNVNIANARRFIYVFFCCWSTRGREIARETRRGRARNHARNLNILVVPFSKCVLKYVCECVFVASVSVCVRTCERPLSGTVFFN